MGSMFRKGSEQSGQSSGISNEMAAMARQLFQESTPLRQAGLGQLGGFMQGGAIPAALTGDIGTQEQELASARQGILASGARGGQMTQALANLPLQRLMMRDALRSGIFNTALGAGLGQAPIAMQGLGNAAGNLNVLGAQRMQQNQAAQAGLGQTLGKALSMGAAYGLPAPGAGSLGGAKLGR